METPLPSPLFSLNLKGSSSGFRRKIANQIKKMVIDIDPVQTDLQAQ